MPLSENDRERIAEALKKAKVNLACPRCGHDHFTVADAYFLHLMQQNPKHYAIGGRGLPCAVTLCTRCGFVAEHSLGILGLLPKEEQTAGSQEEDSK